MSIHENPQALFVEVEEIAELIRQLLTAETCTVTHWPTFYRLYLCIDELANAVHLAANVMPRHDGDMHEDERKHEIDEANGILAILGRRYLDIIELMLHVRRFKIIRSSAEVATSVVTALIAPKRVWYLSLREYYAPGRFADGGIRLERCVCLLPDRIVATQPGLNMFDSVRYQAFEFTDDAAREELIRIAEARRTSLLELMHIMGQVLVTRCPSLHALLNPSCL